MLYLLTIFVLIALGVSVIYSIYKIEAPKQAQIWKEIEATIKKSKDTVYMNNDEKVDQTTHQEIHEAVLCKVAANDEKFPQAEQKTISSKPSSINIVREEAAIPLMINDMNVLFASYRSSTVIASTASTALRKAVVKSRSKSDDLGFANFNELDMVDGHIRSTLSDDFTKVSVSPS
ncbi:hypothetical protein [Acinetobacter sp. AR2-3]|jgi:hypothetical protein|uniref:hypothetical protein n=1 Tax=Acinetobacter sp. AR2-3 TaxID=1891969 RepID=UPI0009000D3D|nr:hypothetical protein [Acinetobacter sp. AR2-3]OIU83079.1 hypothetical protein BFN00_12250 [Acinetobacter sp. AR2-3]